MTLDETTTTHPVAGSSRRTDPVPAPRERADDARRSDRETPADGLVVGSGGFVEDVMLRVPSQRGDPTWEIADLFPRQGLWTEEQYLALDTNRLIEFKDGVLEFLPVSHRYHQYFVRFLFRQLDRFVTRHDLGEALFAPLRFRIRENFVREPDVLFLFRQHVAGDPKQPQQGAGLLMEVVSPGAENRERDLVAKRLDYAEAGVPEYWIVDPETETITVLKLMEGEYHVHGEFRRGETATSVILPGFGIDVAACFDAATAA